MTTLHLVRHAAHVLGSGVLVGRTPGVALSPEGRADAAALAERLAGQGIAALWSSPRRRTRETAAILAERLGLPVRIAPGLDEVDVGDWTGQRFDQLAVDKRWSAWNGRRGSARPPNGESMDTVWARVAAALDAVALEHPDGAVAVVTHAEIVRAVLLRARGLPFDAFLQVDVPLASVATVRWRNGAPLPASEAEAAA